MSPEPDREFLRHAVATLAYRGMKSVRGAPSGFGDFRAGSTSRMPVEILSHIGDLLEWARFMAQGIRKWPDTVMGTWIEETVRFETVLAALDDYLAGDEPLGNEARKIFQGPIADALTHVGQLNYLRRLAESPVRGENYFVADITTGRVGADQPAPNREFD
ncbi:MAG TPA: hypothetical protein VF720_05955 [Candidatus Eisenbacteria bacterium]